MTNQIKMKKLAFVLNSILLGTNAMTQTTDVAYWNNNSTNITLLIM